MRVYSIINLATTRAIHLEKINSWRWEGQFHAFSLILRQCIIKDDPNDKWNVNFWMWYKFIR